MSITSRVFIVLPYIFDLPLIVGDHSLLTLAGGALPDVVYVYLHSQNLLVAVVVHFEPCPFVCVVRRCRLTRGYVRRWYACLL